MNTLRIFVSSPGDVGEERALTERVLRRLQGEFGTQVSLEPIFWEHEPLRATASFQEQILPPSQTDIVIIILWSRLGTRLPEHLQRQDGSLYESGTEFEFEDALEGHRARGTPDLLVYRKTAEQVVPLNDQAVERMEQYQKLQRFIDRWFHGADGSFTAAFHEFSTPAHFEEIIEKHVRKLLQERLSQEGIAPSTLPPPPLWQTGSPFRGLAVFEEEHALVFCGRTKAISEVLNALRKQAAAGQAFVLVLGMSGCGKSSLVRAGVLHRLRRPGVIEGIGLWRTTILRPSETAGDVIDALANALLNEDALPELAANGTEHSELAELLRENPKASIPLIKSGLNQAAKEVQQRENLSQPPIARLMLVVDQMEELFTIPNISPEERKEFVTALSALARSGHVWVLATLRSDFYARCDELPELLGLKEGSGQYDLQPPVPAEITQMIRQPAQLAGLQFEEHPKTQERLDDVLRDAATRDAGSLPLLEFTLNELYQHRTDGGELTHATYAAVGGLEGALAKRAEEVFAGFPPDVQAAFPSVLSHLVSVGFGEGEAVIRQRVPMEMLAKKPESHELVETFIRARLFVTDRRDDGTAAVSVAHEALLSHWPRIQQWVEENKHFLKVRAQIATSAALWKEQERAQESLLSDGTLLAKARTLLLKRRTEFAQQEISFIEASDAKASIIRRRKKVLQISAGLVGFILFSSGIWFWDAKVREVDQYFSTFVKRWGVPQGVGPVSKTEVQRRYVTFRIVTKGRTGPAIRVDAVNGQGDLTSSHDVDRHIKETNDAHPANRESQWIFEYDDNEKLLNEVAKNKNGNRVYMFHYLPGSPESQVRLAQFSDEFGLPQVQAASGAAYVEFTRTLEGLDQLTRYLDVNRQPKPGRDGYSGIKSIANNQGLPESVTYLNALGDPIKTKHGFAKMTIIYDGRGNIKMANIYDEEGQPVRNKDGFVQVAMSYDEWGNPTKFVYSDENRRLVRLKEGYAQVSFTYDDHGNRMTMVLFDKQNQPVRNKDGYAQIAWTYDDRGNQTSQTSKDEKGQPIRHEDGYAQIIWTYDAQGNKATEAYFDENSLPIRHKDGYAQLVSTYDAQGNKATEAYFDENSLPIRHKDGYAQIAWTYDDRGNQTSQTSKDENSQPIRYKNGYAQIIWTYDAQGNKATEAYFDEKGQPIRHKDGYAKWAGTYDVGGNLKKVELFYEQDGLPRSNFGYSKIKVTYDGQGRMITTASFDERGNLFRSEQGYAKVTWTYDDHGNEKTRAFFDELEQPVLNKEEGYFKLVTDYDNHSRATMQSYFATDNRLIVPPKIGCARTMAAFDEKGHQTLEACYGADDNLKIHDQWGYAKGISTYDEQGHKTMMAFLGGDDRLMNHPQAGFAKAMMAYSTNGQEIRKAFFDDNNEPTARNFYGYAKKFVKYDSDGKKIAATHFGPENSTVWVNVVIEEVLPDYQGKAIGLNAGDIIWAYEGQRVNGVEEFQKMTDIGENTSRQLEVSRNGKILTFNVASGKLGIKLHGKAVPLEVK